MLCSDERKEAKQRMAQCKMTLQWLGFGLGLLWFQDAAAIITRDDVTDASYVVADADCPAVIDLFEPGDCLGTVLSAFLP
tara:strand:- start:259 stop:498 length:240 start_codon:yes stop_codon:yes gene_type:complete